MQAWAPQQPTSVTHTHKNKKRVHTIWGTVAQSEPIQTNITQKESWFPHSSQLVRCQNRDSWIKPLHLWSIHTNRWHQLDAITAPVIPEVSWTLIQQAVHRLPPAFSNNLTVLMLKSKPSLRQGWIQRQRKSSRWRKSTDEANYAVVIRRSLCIVSPFLRC